MDLPDFPDLSDEVLRAIAARYGGPVVRLPERGIFNAVFLLGEDLILRVPRDHPDFVAAARREAVAVPAARAAGVRTPLLLAVDDACDLLPVPFLVYERVRGEPLGWLDLEPGATPAVWRELGGDLAHLHTGVARILWRHLQLALWLLQRPPQPGRSWAERPAAMLLEILRFFLDGPGDPWRRLGPPIG